MSGDVHYFDGPGIEEGSGNVPKWFLVLMGTLFVIFVFYIGTYLVGAQPNTARIKKAPATNAADEPTEVVIPEVDGEGADGE